MFVLKKKKKKERKKVQDMQNHEEDSNFDFLFGWWIGYNYLRRNECRYVFEDTCYEFRQLCLHFIFVSARTNFRSDRLKHSLTSDVFHVTSEMSSNRRFCRHG